MAKIAVAQENSLNYFLAAAENNNPDLLQNQNLVQVGQLQTELIRAENDFQFSATSEVMLAPYFNSNGHFMEVTTTPSPNAYGYAEPVSNGALYSAQLNIAKNIFNRSQIQNLQFQNKISNRAIELSSEEIRHQLKKQVTTAYIQVYQLQLRKELLQDLIEGLKNRLEVVELLVKKGILLQSDYLLLQLEIDNRNLEMQQVENNFQSNLLSLQNAVGLEKISNDTLLAPEIPLSAELEVFLSASQQNFQEHLRPTDSLPENHSRKNLFSSLKAGKDSLFFERKYTNDSLQLIAEQQVFENKYQPQLTAYGNTGLNAVDLNQLQHNLGFSAGLRLSIPIYDGGQRSIKRQQQQLKIDNLRTRLQNQELQRNNTLESLRNQLAAIQKGLKLVSRQLQKQENILEIYKIRMLQGQVSVIDYLKMIENYRVDLETQLQMQVNFWLLQNEFNATNW